MGQVVSSLDPNLAIEMLNELVIRYSKWEFTQTTNDEVEVAKQLSLMEFIDKQSI